MTLREDSDKPVFAARLTPYRSLGPVGIRHVVAVFAALAAVPGLYFLSTGMWPIVGALGLATFILWWALSVSLATGKTFEEVTLWRDDLRIRHVTHKGRERQHAFNPFWVRFHVARDYEDRVTRMTLAQRDEAVEIGAFLNPDDKASFAQAFAQALSRNRT